jgi:soluble P-type ATPase
VTHSDVSAALVANGVNGVLLLIAATLAILLVNHIESLQEARLPIAKTAA